MSRYNPVLYRAALLAALVASSAACDDALTDTAALAPESPRANVSTLPSVGFRSLVDTVTKGIIANATEDYVVPSAAATGHFRQAVDSVVGGSVAGADALLDQYGYDVYSIRESTTGDSLVIFRERVAAGSTKVARGWGTLAFNPGAANRADVHVNHPIDDQHTEDIGAELYRDCRCRWFLMAGARRNANADGSADMARSTGSVFHQVYVHVAAADVRTLSIHGFRESSNTSLPDDVDQVLSNGRSTASSTPTYTAADTTLRTRLRSAGFEAGLFAVDSAYTVLGATVNPQGRHSNDSFGFGRWIHVETERNVRDSTTLWRQMNAVLRQWIADFPA